MLCILSWQCSLPLTPPQLRCYAVRFASRIAFGSSGKKAAFTTLNGFTTFGSRFLCKSSRFHNPGAYGTSGEYSLLSPSSPLISQSPDENTGSGNPDRHYPGLPDDLCFLLLNLFRVFVLSRAVCLLFIGGSLCLFIQIFMNNLM